MYTCWYMDTSQTCTGPKGQGFFEVVVDGQTYVHAQSATALPMWSLQETVMFWRWDFYEGGSRTRPNPLMPKAEFERCVRKVIPEYDGKTWILSAQEIAKSKGYARPFT